MWPWLPAVIGAAADLGGMLFSKKQADTAHQREVADLQKAGLHPMLSSLGGRGAAVPDVPSFGDNVQKGFGSALAMEQLRSVKAQTEKTKAETQFLQESMQLRMRGLGAETDVKELDAQRLREVQNDLIAKIRAEVVATSASASRSKALAALDKARLTGELNLQKFEEDIGELGPAARAALELLRGLRGR